MKSLVDRAFKGIEIILMLSLFAMVALTFADVIGRRFFNAPIYGAHDLTEHMMAIIVFTGLPLLTSARGHLSVDLLDRWLMKESFRWWHGLIQLIVASALGLIGYQFIIAAIDARDIIEVSHELLIPREYMYYLIATGSFASALSSLMPKRSHEAIHTEEAL
jgi:TRAP-type C4-dicarboxylate transport system permease small subunit